MRDKITSSIATCCKGIIVIGRYPSVGYFDYTQNDQIV